MQIITDLPYDADYTGEDDDKRVLLVNLPDEPNGACIFFVHGGGWYAGCKEQFTSVMRHFCERGYVCVSAGYRLTPGHQFPTQFNDVRLAYSFTKERAAEWGFDPKRIAVWGSSAGAHLAAMLATTGAEDDLGYSPQMKIRDTRPAAAVCLCSVFSLMPEAETDVLDAVEKFLGGDPANNAKAAELAAQASPQLRVTAEAPPFLMVLGDADDLTPVAHHQAMLDELARHGAHGEMTVLPGVGHGFGYGVEDEAQKRTLEVAERFLADNVK